jgi:hypothetical protein
MSVAVADSDPERSVSLLHDAFTDPDPAPAYWERLIGTFISRYLGRTAPTLAARHLLRLLPEADAGLGSADAVTLATSASLLASTGHAAADDIVVSLTALVPSEHVSAIIGAGADRSHATGVGSDRVLPVLRAALEEIAGNG